jgi:2-polyprenyl-3-methyl-5-hydroxy-6-metoxy-1,4-benzoquinol methylase
MQEAFVRAATTGHVVLSVTVPMPALSPTDSLGAGQFGPEVYAAWRTSSLGEITEALEHRLIFRLTGSLQDCDVLDVGCGDGTLALRIAANGA